VTYPGLSNVCGNPLPALQSTQANACGRVPSEFTRILGTDPIISISSFSTNLGVDTTPIDWTLTFTQTHTSTWTQPVSLTEVSGSSHQMSVVLGTPTPDCDEAIDVYEDFDYHRFVAVPAATPPVACDSN
jgi:hypothetical protein